MLHLCRELTEWRLYGQIAPVASELTKAPYFAHFAVLLALSAGGRPYEGTLFIYVTADADDAGVSQVDLTAFEK